MDGWNTLGAALLALFPEGTKKQQSLTVDPQMGLTGAVPPWPPDLFAAAAYLLDRGGVYHRIIPEAVPPPKWGRVDLVVPLRTVHEWEDLGAEWRRLLQVGSSGSGLPSQEITNHIQKIAIYWNKLTTYWQEEIVRRPTEAEMKSGWRPQRLDWWEPAVALLIIADEACKSLGYIDSHGRHFCDTALRKTIYRRGDLFYETDPGRHYYYMAKVNTFQHAVNPSVTRVVPKSQTPFVGCTLRTLSHNMALVPPQGVVDISWCTDSEQPVYDGGPFNVLLVPFPYVVPATSFVPAGQVPEMPARPAKPWGWFDLKQKWLERPQEGASSIARFTLELIATAEQDCGTVHAVIFPELALNWEIYKDIVETLRDKTSVEFLISGSSSSLSQYVLRDREDYEVIFGNLALTTTFTKIAAHLPRVAHTHSRAKHHRWQLNHTQIAGYGLGSALDPSRVWWERTELPRREIGVTTFRSRNTFATMICEDLARSDPVHEPLRAIGPNIVFVLLMDGAQLPHRWPARYSLTLSDDPGSSILTLTSLGLIERSNATGIYKEKSRAVSIWKDIGMSSSICIECPQGAQGVLMTITAEPSSEVTLDGRVNEDGRTWRYSGHQPVTLRNRKGFEWIIAGIPTRSVDDRPELSPEPADDAQSAPAAAR